MTWNHRVVRHHDKLGTSYMVHEVYYNSKDEVTMMTQDPDYPCGESIEELQQDIERFKLATKQPVLDYDMEFADED